MSKINKARDEYFNFILELSSKISSESAKTIAICFGQSLIVCDCYRSNYLLEIIKSLRREEFLACKDYVLKAKFSSTTNQFFQAMTIETCLQEIAMLDLSTDVIDRALFTTVIESLLMFAPFRAININLSDILFQILKISWSETALINIKTNLEIFLFHWLNNSSSSISEKRKLSIINIVALYKKETRYDENALFSYLDFNILNLLFFLHRLGLKHKSEYGNSLSFNLASINPSLFNIIDKRIRSSSSPITFNSLYADNFYALDIRNLEFVDLDLNGASLEASDCSGSSFINCNLKNISYIGTNFSKCLFKNCKLNGAFRLQLQNKILNNN